MIDRIKALFTTISSYFMDALLGALAIAGAVIYYLSGRNKTLSGQVAELKAEDDIRKTLVASDEAKKEADASEGDYTKLRDEYLNENKGD